MEQGKHLDEERQQQAEATIRLACLSRPAGKERMVVAVVLHF